MKRFLACIAFIVLALVTVTEQHSPERGDVLSCLQECPVIQSAGHAIAYAENGVSSQVSSGSNFSTRSNTPTLSIGNNIPSPSFNGHSAGRKAEGSIGKVHTFHTRLYVLRV